MKNNMIGILLALCILCTQVFAQDSTEPTAQKDPLEKFNRAMFSLNETLDKYFFKPAGELYNKIVPKPLAKGITNMYSNVSMLPTTANDLLQGNFYQATSDAWRFAINTTAGLGGFYDVSSNIGLRPHSEDFGLTLAKWGYTDSTYLVLPLWGPRTVRDTIGLPVDYYAFSVYSRIDDAKTRDAIYALGAVSTRASLLQYQDLYEEIAIDKYAFVRNAYLQKRAADIKANQQLSDPYYDRRDYTSANDLQGPDNVSDEEVDPYQEMMQQQSADETNPVDTNDPYYQIRSKN